MKAIPILERLERRLLEFFRRLAHQDDRDREAYAGPEGMTHTS
jgi:hypothetical protein